jgi:hypothetical protein
MTSTKMILENWRAFVNEAAFTPAQVPQGWKFTIEDNESSKVIVSMIDHHDKVVAKIVIQNDERIPCVEALSVESVFAPKGYGPMLYDLAMELAGEKGIYSDRVAVSSAAQKIWEFYEHRRNDVESFHPLEFIDETESECFDDVVHLFGEEWEEEPSNKIFRKISGKTATLEALKNAGKIKFI